MSAPGDRMSDSGVERYQGGLSSEGDRWQRVWDAFHGALEQPSGERAAYLEAACGGDRTLRDEVLSLLAEHGTADHLLDRGLRLVAPPRPVAPPGAVAAGVSDSHVGQRYQLFNVLGSGGMGEVYRTLDRLTGRVVALKKILSSPRPASPSSTSAVTLTAPGAGHPTGKPAATRGVLLGLRSATPAGALGRELALAREFRLLASLRHPHIISVLDYGFDAGGRPFFTMPLLEDAETVLEAGAGVPLDVRIDFLSRILQALEYLHRQGVIHRDLKPNNVLVSDGRLKLLDFGISIVGSEAEREAARAAGTLLYMAPETLMGEPASAAADLFAVGVVAYQLLAGRHPFAGPQAGALGALIQRMTAEPADLRRLEAPEAVRAVVARLLAPRPEARFNAAAQAQDELCRAAGRPVPEVAGTIRDSFLQAARFVGREGELEALARRLAAAASGRGGVRLIAGESGVGKSRLLEELRTLALVEGILVVRGQAVRHGGRPYQAWRGAVRRLVLGCELSDLEAGTLASLVPDLGELLGRPIEAAPALEPQAARDRLRTVIGELFRRQRSAVLVILEDLHWADGESLELLARLDRVAAELPLLILGSLRDDERLPESLDGVGEVLRLGRLDEGAVGELSASMLGDQRARPELVALLVRETEGNAFFLVEAVRALAEEAGGLDRVAAMALPDQIAAGGIRRVVRRRLERVPGHARPLLRSAAVAGRQLNLEVLARLAPRQELEPWLAACAAASVLEVEDDVWRFQHDKLREGILEEVAAAELPELHRRLALAIESLPSSSAPAAALAHHWLAAGDGERARHAAERAGREALANGAHQDAIRWLRRATELHRRHGARRYRVGALERRLALAHYSLGQLAPTRECLRRSLALLGWPAPGGRLRLGVSLLAHLLLQTLHRAAPDRWRQRRSARGGQGRRERRVEAVRACRLLCEVDYITGKPLRLLHGMLRALNMAESCSTPPGESNAGDDLSLLASVYGASATMFGLIHRSLGPIYIRRAHAAALDAVARRGRHLPDVAFTFLATSGFHLGIGAFDAAEEDLRRGDELYRLVGDGRRWGQVVAWQAAIAELRGEHESCRQYALLICDSSERRGDDNTRAYGLTYRASMALLRGEPERAVEHCRQALAGLEGNIDRVEEKRARSLLARARLRLGDAAAAWSAAEAAARLSAGSPPTMPHSLTGYASVAEVTLALWERELEAGAEAAARRAVRELERYARAFPLGRPRARLARGRLAWLDGRVQAARRADREALRAARGLGMPLEEALAHGQLGRHLESADGECKAHREQAERLLAKLGVCPDSRSP